MGLSGRGGGATPRAQCLLGKKGLCLDINTEVCNGAEVTTGFCAGRTNIKCCLAPGIVALSEAPKQYMASCPSPFHAGHTGWRCSSSNDCYGDPKNINTCLKVEAFLGMADCVCDPTAVGNSGPAPPGAGRADGSDVAANQIGQDGADMLVGLASCVRGAVGNCIDVSNNHVCDGASVLTGHCVGPAEIKCCPAPGVPRATSSSVVGGGGAGPSSAASDERSCVDFIPVTVTITTVATVEAYDGAVLQLQQNLASGSLRLPAATDWWSSAIQAPLSPGPEVGGGGGGGGDSSNAESGANLQKDANERQLGWIAVAPIMLLLGVGIFMLYRQREDRRSLQGLGSWSRPNLDARGDVGAVMMNAMYQPQPTLKGQQPFSVYTMKGSDGLYSIPLEDIGTSDSSSSRRSAGAGAGVGPGAGAGVGRTLTLLQPITDRTLGKPTAHVVSGNGVSFVVPFAIEDATGSTTKDGVMYTTRHPIHSFSQSAV